MPWMRAAAAMFSLTTRWMPHAASVSPRPRGPANAAPGGRRRSEDGEPQAPAEEEVRVEIAEDEVGVGHRGLPAAEAVAHRPGIGPGAVGPDLQEAERVDARDGAAAGADLDHLDHRNADGQARALL